MTSKKENELGRLAKALQLEPAELQRLEKILKTDEDWNIYFAGRDAGQRYRAMQWLVRGADLEQNLRMKPAQEQLAEDRRKTSKVPGIIAMWKQLLRDGKSERSCAEIIAKRLTLNVQYVRHVVRPLRRARKPKK
jgi:hypothetical protein